MAKFDEKNNQVILSEEDKQAFREANVNLQNHKTPIADSIMEKILPNKYPDAFTSEKEQEINEIPN